MNTVAGIGAHGADRDSLDDFVDHLNLRYHHPTQLSDLSVVADGSLIAGPKAFTMTRKAATDLSRFVNVPASYMLESPGDIAAWNFNKKLPGTPGSVTIVENLDNGAAISLLRPTVNPLTPEDFLTHLPAENTVKWWDYSERGLNLRQPRRDGRRGSPPPGRC